MNFPAAKAPYDHPVTITFTTEEYNLLLWVVGAGYRAIQEKGQAGVWPISYTTAGDLERLDQLRAHIISARSFRMNKPLRSN